MRTIIVNGTVINGDGHSVWRDHSIAIEDGIITDVIDKPYLPFDPADRILDARGGVVAPGAINHHSHGGVLGPFNVFGEVTLSPERVRQNLNRHMSGGTTTVVNACGWPIMAEVEATNKRHPVNIFAGTVHAPAHLRHSRAVDGLGLKPWHESASVAEMLEQGAAAIGEVGAPCAAHGTPQISRELNRPLGVRQVQDLKEAALGPGVDPDAFDRDRVIGVLEQTGLADVLTPDQVRDLMDRHVVHPYRLTVDCVDEFAELSLRHDATLLFHNTPDTWDLCLDIAGKIGHRLVALHCNYAFTPEEAVKNARELRARGAKVDIFTGDSFGAQAFIPRPDTAWALFEHRLVDLVSTDYIAGYWDAPLMVLDQAVRAGFLTAPQAVGMCTGNVLDALPRLGRRRGRIAPGQAADVIVTRADSLARLRWVIIGGRIVWPDPLPVEQPADVFEQDGPVSQGRPTS